MGPLLLLVLLGVVAALLKLVWERSAVGKTSSALKDLPGPERSLVLGNSHELGEGAAMVRQFLGWFEEFGSPTRISFGPFHAIHIHKADHVEAMLKCTKNTSKSYDYEFVSEWLGHGLLTSNQDRWNARSSLPPFTSPSSKTSWPSSTASPESSWTFSRLKSPHTPTSPSISSLLSPPPPSTSSAVCLSKLSFTTLICTTTQS